MITSDGSERDGLSPILGLFVTQNAELLRLDGNAALADIDLDPGCLIPFLVELMAEHHGGDDERGD
jgi:hypothetical protein